ncbi:Lactose-binding protein precursor [Paraliobacillus sp. PM-2]|uniref:ABC transporter substrate-binding protein n=1 Tax=Paraliobacillus sp. PM-2 TaxID=1462524 RepID=UPI00061CD3B4|nr:ABC transporter substrate-binding protein [Paraliobacillus sp. PM-2]CQR45952.1 Lactose-binding protein precursor [Paraliobacillus sp. PM-2]
MLKNVFKRFSWLLGLALLITMLAACSEDDQTQGSANDSGDEGTSEFEGSLLAWAWDQNFNVAALEIAQNYFDEELKMEIVDSSSADIVQRLNAGLSSGTMKGMPNIVLIEDGRAQTFLRSYPNAFYPIGEYFNTDDFASYKIAPTSYDGKQYGLPFDTGVTGLFYRKDILEEAGYSEEDLQNITWGEYVDIAIEVKEKTGTAMISLDPNDLGIIRMMLQSAGSWYTTPDDEINIENNDALKLALENYKKLMDSEAVYMVSDWSNYIGSFNNGDAATVPTGNWMAPSIEQAESQAGLWRVAPIPRLDIDGAKNAANLGGSSWYVLNIDGKEKAAEFLGQTFGSNKDFYQDLVTEIGAIGTFKAASEGEAYQIEDDFFGGQKLIYKFSQWMEDIPQIDSGINTNGIEGILEAEMQNYLKGESLEDVLNNTQEQAENQFK